MHLPQRPHRRREASSSPSHHVKSPSTTTKQQRQGTKREAKDEGEGPTLPPQQQSIKRGRKIPGSLDDYGGDVRVWIEKMHEYAAPQLSKFERSLPEDDGVIRVVASANAKLLDSPKSLLEADWRYRPVASASSPIPQILLLSNSADRACERIKELSVVAGGLVGKLFARHIKVGEQAEFLRRNRPRICVGTPGRVLVLIEEGHLSLEGLQVLVADCLPDAKTFHVANMPGEVSRDFFTVLRKSMEVARTKREKSPAGGTNHPPLTIALLV